MHRSESGADAPWSPAALRDLGGVPIDSVPRHIEPQLATLETRPRAGQRWVHEIKFDGYRALVRSGPDGVAVHTRRGENWTERFGVVATAVERLGLPESLLDGEVVVTDERGVASFSLLQRHLGRGPDADLTYYVFDLPYCNGFDLRGLPLLDRKRVLAALIGEPDRGRVVYSRHLVGEGQAIFDQACGMGVEGIVSKRVDGHYISGRNRGWVKVKCTQTHDFVVVGYVVRPETAGSGMASLILGAHNAEGNLVHVGRVGTGFSDQERDAVKTFLEDWRTEASPIEDPPQAPRGDEVHWVEPMIVVSVEYTEMTHEGILRHPSFKGVKTGVDPREVPLP